MSKEQKDDMVTKSLRFNATMRNVLGDDISEDLLQPDDSDCEIPERPISQLSRQSLRDGPDGDYIRTVLQEADTVPSM